LQKISYHLNITRCSVAWQNFKLILCDSFNASTENSRLKNRTIRCVKSSVCQLWSALAPRCMAMLWCLLRIRVSIILNSNIQFYCALAFKNCICFCDNDDVADALEESSFLSR